MKLHQLEDVLSSACNTYSCLIRAHAVVSRVTVTKLVQTHLNGLSDATEAMKVQMADAIMTTGRAIHKLSDDWAHNFSLIRGARTRIGSTHQWVEGAYRGLWPSEASGYMVVLLSDIETNTFIKSHNAKHEILVSNLRFDGFPSVAPKFPLRQVHPVIPDIGELHAFQIPIQLARRSGLSIAAA